MPLLPLPPADTALTGGDLPVSTPDDVLKEFPKTHLRPQVAPVRDAFATAFCDGFLEYQNDAAYAANQSNPILATGDYLLSFCDEHSIVPGPGESESSVRSRMFKSTEIVSPGALYAGIVAITGTPVVIFEPELDGWFVHDDTASNWDSFIGTQPSYPDRYYTDLPHRNPSGAVPSLGYPRNFHVYIPTVSDAIAAQVVAYVQSAKPQGMSWSLSEP